MTMTQRVWTVLLALLMWSTELRLGHGTHDISGSGSDYIYINTTTSTKTTLRILIIAPFPDTMFHISYDGGNNLIPSALMAVSEINEDPNILADYHLEPVVGDGGCSVTEKAVSSILDNVIYRGEDRNIIGIAGPVCSEATLILSELLNQNRIRLPLVTVANSPVLANTTRYPFTFGIVSTSAEYAGTVVKILSAKLKSGQWNKIAILYDSNRDYHHQIYRAVRDEMKSNELNDTKYIYAFPISETYMPLENLIEFETRVAFVFASKRPACMLMCRAFHLKMHHPTYQFIFTDRRLSHFQSCDNDSLVFYYDSKKYECTIDDILITIRGFLLFGFNLESLSLEPNTTQAVSGYTFSEYRERYEKRLDEYNATLEEEVLSPTPWAAPLYDAVWAVALAANQTLPKLDFDSQLGIWDDQQLMKVFNELTFRGISTSVKFKSKSGFSHSTINIFHIENETSPDPCLVGYYDNGSLFDKDNRNSNINVLNVFIESSFEMSTETIPAPLWISGYVLAAIILVATITFHVLHLKYRKRPSLKASSPTLTHFIFLGCYTLLAGVLLDSTIFAVSPKDSRIHLILCYIVVWLENLGTTFVFSTLFVKYYRLYLVFLRTYDHRSNLSNRKLTLLAMVLVAIDVVILALWIPFKPLEVINRVELDTTDTETPVNREIKICKTTEVGRWFTTTTNLYLAVLILAVVTLSILNRRIKQRAFNTTLATNALVYVYLFLLSIALPVVYIDKNSENMELQYGTLNALYLTFIVLCHIFLFTPPLVLKNRRSRKYSLATTMRKMSYMIALSRVHENEHIATSL